LRRGARLLGTELVTLLVGIAYFAGLSVGYRLSGRITASLLVACLLPETPCSTCSTDWD
jgi:hypothetical protein